MNPSSLNFSVTIPTTDPHFSEEEMKKLLQQEFIKDGLSIDLSKFSCEAVSDFGVYHAKLLIMGVEETLAVWVVRAGEDV